MTGTKEYREALYEKACSRLGAICDGVPPPDIENASSVALWYLKIYYKLIDSKTYTVADYLPFREFVQCYLTPF